MTPEVSVIMGVYNEFNKDKLYRAIESILNQTVRNLELIIYNDGSDQIVRDYLEKIAESDERISVINEEKNRGLGYALNSCIKRAKGKFIARMDADDISAENRFGKQIEFLSNHKEYSWCGTNAGLFDENGVWGSRQMPVIPGKTDYLKYSPFIHPSVMFRRELFDKQSGYETEDKAYRCEDYELFMRLYEQGYKGANLQEPLIFYRENKDSFERRNLKRRLSETKVRYHYFKALKMLFPLGWIYVVRPIAAAFVPNSLIRIVKRKEDGNSDAKL